MENLPTLALAVPDISLGTAKFKTGYVTFGHAPSKGDLSFMCLDLTQFIGVQNLTTLASAVPEIYRWCPSEFKWFTWPDHVLSGMICHPWASTYYNLST